MKRKRLPCLRDQGITGLAEDLKVLSDVNRLRILCLLLGGERCVCEVERELGISQQLASHHLNVLKDSGFLRSRKEGSSSYYSVVPDRLKRMMDIFERYLSPEGREKRGVKGNRPAIPRVGTLAGMREPQGDPTARGPDEEKMPTSSGGRGKI